MLKQATLFKDFTINTNADNTAVTFVKNGGITVSVKNDNFAEQVQIYDASGEHDLFDYKYITFDNSAVFEITDCIQNGNYSTLFIQYLSNISFDSPNTNFRVEGVSVRHLQNLGMDINELLKILGSNTEIDKVHFGHTHNKVNSIMFAVRLRFEQLPQNLVHQFTGKEIEVDDKQWLDKHRAVGSVFHDPEKPRPTETTTGQDYTVVDQNINVVIPIPFADKTNYICFDKTTDREVHFGGFLNTLKSLLTDLVVSAELTILNSESIQLFDMYGEDMTPFLIGYRNTGQFFMDLDITPEDSIFGATGVMIPAEFTEEFTSNGETKTRADFSAPNGGVPVFVNTKALGTFGIVETLNFIEILTPFLSGATLALGFSILGCRIDLSTLRTQGTNAKIYIKRDVGHIKIYTDLNKNLYTEIPTEIEYSKNAFSNYNAYKKSNIDLANQQKDNTLKMAQEQQRSTQNLDLLIKAGNTITRSALSFGVGGIAGGVGALVGGAVDAVAQEAKFNMQQQNNRANVELSKEQAHNIARATIVPAEVINGSMSLLSAFINQKRTATQGTAILYSFDMLELTDTQHETLKRYIFDNHLLEKLPTVTSTTDLAPSWHTNTYQVSLKNRSPLNTRKDLTVFCKKL